MPSIREILGRATERRIIADAVAGVADGRGLVLSITGEPGVGKTILAGEALRQAGASGFRTLRGTCARFQAAVSFAPLVQALYPLVEPTEHDLTAGLPELARLFAGLPTERDGPARDPGTERSRLFDAVHTLIRRAAAARPVALLIDDIHWADPSSLDLLAYLALCLGDDRCLFVVTDRGEPVDAVRRFRAPLRRADRVVDVRLGPLTPDQVAALVAEELAGEPPQPLLELLDGRAKGVPLYVISLLASLRARGRLFRSGGRWVLGAGPPDGLPDELVDVIADRLDELAASELDILAALGVWGDGVTRGMVAALMPDGEAAVEHLDRLVAAGLVDERVRGTVSYHARHPLVVEAAGARLSARERRRLHAAAAHHLLERARSADAGLIAHHVRLAGPAFDRTRALEILTGAAEEAGADRGGHESLLLAEAAVTLIRQAGRADLLPGALERVAESAALAGAAATAIDAWREAIGARGGDGIAAGRCRRRLALLQLEHGDPDGAARTLDEATDLDGPRAIRERYRVLLLRITFALRSDDRVRLGRELTEFRPVAEQLGLGAMAELFERYVDTPMDRIIIIAGTDDTLTLAATVANSVTDNDQTLVIPWHRPWIVDALARGDPPEAIRRAHQVPEHSAVSPGTYSAAIALEAFAHWLAGEWDTALRLTGHALVIAHRQANHRSVALSLVVRGLVLVHRGDLDRAQECVADARSMFGRGDKHTVSTIDTVAGVVALARGRRDEALTTCGQASPINYLGLLTLSVQVTMAARDEDRDRLDRLAGQVGAVAGPWAAALSCRVMGLQEGDPAALTEAADALAALGMPYEAALVHLESADLEPAMSSTAQRATVAQVMTAMATFDRLGAAPAADRARRLLRRLGHRPPPGRPTGRSLSEREQQVAALVALGLSNAEVANRLFISPRTVTTHLERIYRRLGLSSRAELSRYVAASGEPGLRRATDTVPLPARTD